MAKVADLKTKTDDELSTELKKPSRVKEVRRSIAQIKTLQTERNSSAAK